MKIVASTSLVICLLGASPSYAEEPALTRELATSLINRAISDPGGAPMLDLPLEPVMEIFRPARFLTDAELQNIAGELQRILDLPDADYRRVTQEVARLEGKTRTAGMPGYFQVPALDAFRKLDRLGLIAGIGLTLTRSGPGSGVLVLIGKGRVKDELRHLCQASYRAGDNCTFVYATRRLVAVTGIRDYGLDRLVEFKMEIVPTELARRVAAYSSSFEQVIGQARIEDRSAVFVRYDDGWRMAKSK